MAKNCSILSQKVPKLELYKHNDELFNIYYLGYKTVLTDTILKGDHPRIISAKFGWDWLSSFRGEEQILISSPLFWIFYELWTFAYFDRLCKLEKRGDEIKKNSSPLKLLSQSQPNFAEMILGWSPRGKEKKKIHPPFFLICIIGQNRQKFKVHKKSCNTY
jgi:hypothetical protein